MGSPESLKMHGFPIIFYDSFRGMKNVGGPESLKSHDFLRCFMISLVEWECGEPRTIGNALISQHFS